MPLRYGVEDMDGWMVEGATPPPTPIIAASPYAAFDADAARVLSWLIYDY